MRKAMFTIEVLIALFVLFLTITLSAMSSKFFNQILSQQEHYKELYIYVFNIKDKISDEICLKNNSISNQIDGLLYKAECTKVKESRSFQKDYDIEEQQFISGYEGEFKLTLYKVNLKIPKYNYQIDYYISRYSK